ncbi:MAG: penicillin-binding transpeptidase domain-containing protein, partial [Ruthenibacterium sp.]
TSYFTDRLIEDVSNGLSAEYGLSRAETTNLLYNGGLRIYTTVDANLQSVMEQNMENGAKYFPQPAIDASVPVRDEDGNPVKDENGKETPQAAMVSVGYDGGLKAVVGGIGEKEISRGFNRGTDAVRQVGSTMKPIGAYALALEKNRITWSTALLDAPVRKIEDEATGEKRDWPANFTKTYANSTMLVADALAQSINTIAVRVGERAGIRSIYNFTRAKLDITSFTGKDCAAGPMVLGSSTYGVTPYELAGAYMMFGSGGTFTTLHSYTDVQTGTGRSILQPTLATEQVIGRDTAYVMNRLLKGVMQGAGTGAGYSVQGNMESIGKTGTTSDNRDYWFVGLTPYYVTATWYGYDSGAALNTSMGTHAPTTAWRAVMQQTQRGMPYAEFPTDDTVATASYCTESGGLATAGCPNTRTGYYRAGTLPGTCILHRA